MLQKDLNKTTVLSLASMAVWEVVNHFRKWSVLNVWQGPEYAPGCRAKIWICIGSWILLQYQPFLRNIKINNLLKSLKTDYIGVICTTQKKFSTKDFNSKCDQIRRKLWIWSHLPKKTLMVNLISLIIVFGVYMLL